jgi:hypothetical protein
VVVAARRAAAVAAVPTAVAAVNRMVVEAAVRTVAVTNLV